MTTLWEALAWRYRGWCSMITQIEASLEDTNELFEQLPWEERKLHDDVTRIEKE